MARELARRGDLVLMLLERDLAAGLYREAGDKWAPSGRLDADEWWWVLHCAAPLAVRACPRVNTPGVEVGEDGALPTPSSPEPEQTALEIDGTVA